MQRDTPDEVYNNITSSNQRLMREMEDYLASVDSSFSAAAPRPPPRPQPSYADQNDHDWMQQSHNCSVIFERSTEDCDNDLSDANLQQSAGERRGQHMEDHEDSFHNRLQRIDETIDTALNSLQSNSKGKPVQEYEYYNDPKYQKKKHRERSSASVDDDSLVAMAKRLDDASVISDPSVIVGTREKGIPNLTAAAQQFRSYEYNRKSSNNSAKTRPARDDRSGHNFPRRSSRGSCTSSTSSSSSHSQRTREVSSSSNTTRYKTDNDAKTSSASTARRARAFGTHQSSKSHFKDDKGESSSNRNAFVDDRRSENCRQPQPPPPKTTSSSYHRKNSTSRFAEAKHLRGDLKSTRREEKDNTGACDGPWAIPRQCYSDFRTLNNNSTPPQDSDNDDDGDESDHTEIFYETDDDEGSYDEEDEDEYDPRAVGTSVADAVKDLNDLRPLKKFTGLFAKKNKREEDNWSIMTQREL